MSNHNDVIDPIEFQKWMWPHITLTAEQKEILYSVRDNDETFVPAGNELGKDFVAALCALWFFCSRSPARVVATSVEFGQLNDVFWGEIRGFIATAKYNFPFGHHPVGMRAWQVRSDGTTVPKAEMIGKTVAKGEAMLGRHIPRDGMPRTLAIFDEASGIEDTVYEKSDTWTHRKLIIGNCFPCSNFFKRGVKGGDKPRPDGNGYYRKVIRIKAESSVNVRLAQAEIRNGMEPSSTILIPGIVEYQDYIKRRELWDEELQCVGLDADWYEGAAVLLFPPKHLEYAKQLDDDHPRNFRQSKAPKYLSCDSAEGGDNTSWAIVDRLGLGFLQSMKTPDTSIITTETIILMRKFKVEPENVIFDSGGGGKQHADRLRRQGLNVRTVGFGESTKPPRKRGMTIMEKKKLEDEERYVYKNRRSEMYGIASIHLDPAEETGFMLPREILSRKRRDGNLSLGEQLEVIPRITDGEGRIDLPPKSKHTSKESTTETLVKIIGCSPDEADAFVMAVYAMLSKPLRRTAGAIAV